MIIAIDGPVAAGKGTLARRIAATLDFAHMDTGMIYRAVAARLLAEGGTPEDPERAILTARDLRLEDLERPDLRDETVGQGASVVAAIPEVRSALLALQRQFAAQPPDGKAGAVLDGRDIGTVVCPAADVKLFVTADLESRARRRHKELQERGDTIIYARVLEDMRARDARDSARAAAPLVPAADAITLDTSEMDAETALEAALAIIASRMPGQPASTSTRPTE